VLGASSYAVAAPSAPSDATHRVILQRLALLELRVGAISNNVSALQQEIGAPGLPTSTPYSVGGQLNQLRSDVDAIYRGACRSGGAC
jgi:hypothetical protein